MSNARLRRFTSMLAALLMALSLSVTTGACVFQTDDDADVEEPGLEEEEGTEVETEVEVEDEETP